MFTAKSLGGSLRELVPNGASVIFIIIFTLLLRESSPNKFHRETQQPEAKKYSLNSSVDILHHLHHSTLIMDKACPIFNIIKLTII